MPLASVHRPSEIGSLDAGSARVQLSSGKSKQAHGVNHLKFFTIATGFCRTRWTMQSTEEAGDRLLFCGNSCVLIAMQNVALFDITRCYQGRQGHCP